MASGWDFPRSPMAARAMSAYGREQGLRDVEVLGPLDPAQLTDDARLIRAADELDVVRRLLALLPEQTSLGVALGQRFRLSDFNFLGFALLTSADMGEAIEVGARYLQLTSAFVGVHWSRPDGVLELTPPEIAPELAQTLFERDLVCLLELLQGIVASSLLELGLGCDLADRASPGLVAYLADHGLAATSHATVPTLTFPVQTLLLAPAQANPAAVALCLEQCERALATRRPQGLTADAVRRRLLAQAQQMPSVTDVAQEWGITRRTLHRRLDAEGTSYREVREQVRRELAVELLDAGLGVGRVAHRLGYADSASFNHAFRRWFDVAPSAWARRPPGRIAGR